VKHPYDREEEMLRVGCAFLLALFIVAFLVGLPWLEELSQDPYEQLRRDEQRRSDDGEYGR
jgi:hypothetical protein